jgi:hypothetical protein
LTLLPIVGRAETRPNHAVVALSPEMGPVSE